MSLRQSGHNAVNLKRIGQSGLRYVGELLQRKDTDAILTRNVRETKQITSQFEANVLQNEAVGARRWARVLQDEERVGSVWSKSGKSSTVVGRISF